MGCRSFFFPFFQITYLKEFNILTEMMPLLCQPLNRHFGVLVVAVFSALEYTHYTLKFHVYVSQKWKFGKSSGSRKRTISHADLLSRAAAFSDSVQGKRIC